MKLKITVTKEIYEKSALCGSGFYPGFVADNCAVALAVRDVFPDASVGTKCISVPAGNGKTHHLMQLPEIAREMIGRFDDVTISIGGLVYRESPEYLALVTKMRCELPEFSFEIDVPEEVIESIDVSSVYEGHPTLEFV